MNDITAAKSDLELFKLLADELMRRLPRSVHEDRDKLCTAIRQLPRGLRAMVAIHRLDVSMATGDLGWHFANFYHPGLCDETMFGLQELGANEAAEIFEYARREFESHWQKVGDKSEDSLKSFKDWYGTSGLEAVLKPANQRLWNICAASPERGLLEFWLAYARKNPQDVIDE